MRGRGSPGPAFSLNAPLVTHKDRRRGRATKFWKTENDLAAWRNQTPKSLHGAKPASSQRPVHSRPPDELRTHRPVKTRVREERSGKGESLYREQDAQLPLPSRKQVGCCPERLGIGDTGSS